MVSLSPTSLAFGLVRTDTTSTKSLVLTNSGTGPLSITSTIHAEPNPPFAATDNCGSSLAANSSCTVQVTFTPSAIQAYPGTLTIDSNADNSPHAVVALTGEGTNSNLTIDQSSLDFGKQLRTTSQMLSVMLTNSGNAALKFSGATVSGQDAAQFQSNGQDCASRNPIGPQQSCSVSVTFTPTSTGTKTAMLQVSSDDPASPHSIGLTGQGTDFSVGMAPGSSDSATVNAGQAATYNLSIAPVAGFEGNTTLTCTWNGAQPRGTACSVTPSTVSVNGIDVVNATVRVTTTSRSMAPVTWEPQPPAPNSYPVSHLGLSALATLALRRRRATVVLASVLFLVVLWTACGGGSTPTPIPTPTGTPAGTYSLTVTGANGSVTSTTGLTLVVN